MHTETNGLGGKDAVTWLRKEWANVHRLKQDGVPLIGFTWYSLQDQVDWDTGLRENNGHVNSLGLCDLSRTIQPVGYAYKELIAEWRQILPTESTVLGIAQE
jgi:beta-glucosidase/6-phospho-beta-glucosidase/beta-galactosidase